MRQTIRQKRKTAGELTLKAKADQTKYDAREIGHALVEDNSIADNLVICARRHRDIFDEDEYCVGYVIASDPLLKGIMRRKFFAMLYLPSPRPEQAVFLYNKRLDQITKRLWVLPACASNNPNAWTMEKLYLASSVPKGYETMKRWSMAFYDGIFWHWIRHEHNITMLSEHEYLQLNREKLVQSCPQDSDASIPQSFDVTKVSVDQIIDPLTASLNKNGFDNLGKTENTDRNISTHVV